ncbi:MAG: peptidase M28A family [Ignavibacteria bacterium]|nr:MAG: peptidase M28A family [Ignavibacteria bacterium]KAF0159584.1 MAG: peptidase M28A family [Ignavibacteria bacterium]
MKLAIAGFVLCLFFSTVFSQTTIVNRDPKISSMIENISAANIESTVRKLVSFGTRHSFSSRSSKEQGIGAAYEWLKNQFETIAKDSEGRMIVKLDSFYVEPDGKRIPRRILMTNPTAILKGTDKDDNRVFIVAGHIDSRNGNPNDSTSLSPGANDDASGVAAVLEIARIMSKQKLPATIVFAAFSGEEQGLHGASFLAKKAKDEKWNLVAMLNNDMIGNSFSNQTLLKDNMQVRVFSEGVPLFETDEMKSLRQSTNAENDSKSRQLARYIKEVGERYVDQIEVKLIYRSDRFLRGGDHTPFNRLGFTAVRFCEMNENYDYQHQDVKEVNGVQYGDLPEYVDYEYARKITCVNLAVLANLALAPAQPRNVGIITKEVTNNTTLQWEAQKNSTAKGYYVLLRETYMPFWEKKIFTTKTEITLPYSKDNYFFAVQSVSEQGHESLPVFPFPLR